MALSRVKRKAAENDTVFSEDSSTTSDGNSEPESDFTNSARSNPSERDLINHVITDLLDAKRWTMTKLEDSDKKIKVLNESISSIQDQNEKLQKKTDEKFERTQDSIRSSEIRSVQVLSTLAALISLVLAYVNIASAQTDLLNALFILLAATFGIILFIVLINQILDTDNQRSSRNTPLLWVSAIGLLVILGLSFVKTYLLEKKESRESQTSEQSTSNKSATPAREEAGSASSK